ncbi:MAG: Sjogren's syndrome/scleroderma autoantigen 1 family protein [Candidatus Asgardarchaeia archaeon]
MSSDEVVKRMATLLHKGAIMLSETCKKCGTPLFKYENQIICPKCDFDYNKEEKTREKYNMEIGKSKQSQFKEYLERIQDNTLKLIEKITNPDLFFSDPEKYATIIIKLLEIIEKIRKFFDDT